MFQPSMPDQVLPVRHPILMQVSANAGLRPVSKNRSTVGRISLSMPVHLRCSGEIRGRSMPRKQTNETPKPLRQLTVTRSEARKRIADALQKAMRSETYLFGHRRNSMQLVRSET